MTVWLALLFAQALPGSAPASSAAVDPAPQEDIVVTARRLNWFKARVLKNRAEDPWHCEVQNSSGNERLDQRMCQGMIACATELEPRFHSAEALATARQSDESRLRYLRDYRKAVQPCYNRERRAMLAEVRTERQAQRRAGK